MKKTKPQYWKNATQELSERCDVMARLIEAYPGEILLSRGRAFETLFRSIVGQQISVLAAQAVWERVKLKVLEIEPENILNFSDADLRACGLSQRKVEYSRDLAMGFISGKLQPTEWDLLKDEEIIQQLCQIRGIGRWTAEMFLIFYLLRPNIFPTADIGLLRAISKEHGRKYPMSQRTIEKYRKLYSPWGTVATWYFWRALDPIPVEY